MKWFERRNAKGKDGMWRSRCDYDGTLKEDYSWMRGTTTKVVVCSFYKRRLIAIDAESKVLESDCLAKDLSCSSSTSITIWDKSVLIACPYQDMARISKLTVIENHIAQDPTSQYAYKVTEVVTVCGFKAHRTTDQLLLMLESDERRAVKLPKSEVELARIHKLMLAEKTVYH